MNIKYANAYPKLPYFIAQAFVFKSYQGVIIKNDILGDLRFLRNFRSWVKFKLSKFLLDISKQNK